MRMERGGGGVGGENEDPKACVSLPLPPFLTYLPPPTPLSQSPSPAKAFCQEYWGSVGRVALSKLAFPGTTPRGALEREDSQRSSWRAAPLSFGGTSLGWPEKGPPACRSSGFIWGDPALLVEVGIICWHDLLSSLKFTPLLPWEPSLLRSKDKKPAWVTRVQENRIDIFCS